MQTSMYIILNLFEIAVLQKRWKEGLEERNVQLRNVFFIADNGEEGQIESS